MSQGEIGEILFHQAHEGKLERIDGLKGDFVCSDSGLKVELKTDYWMMSKTPNFFFERFSNEAAGTPGGPWQSVGHGADIFVYFYIKDLTFYTFSTKELVAALEAIIPELEPCSVKNSSWTTIGYRVPREWLKEICTVKKMKVSVE